MRPLIGDARVPVLLAATLLASATLFAGATGHAGERDHLKCYKIRDPLRFRAPVTLTNRFGEESCKVRAPARLFCAETEKNAGDDPRGGPPGNLLCYRITCKGPLPPASGVDDQFGTRVLQSVRSRFLCAPAARL
jgi:hypothetical protein